MTERKSSTSRDTSDKVRVNFKSDYPSLEQKKARATSPE